MEKNVPEDATATSCRHKKASQQYSHQLTPVRLPLLKAMAGRAQTRAKRAEQPVLLCSAEQSDHSKSLPRGLLEDGCN